MRGLRSQSESRGSFFNGSVERRPLGSSHPAALEVPGKLPGTRPKVWKVSTPSRGGKPCENFARLRGYCERAEAMRSRRRRGRSWRWSDGLLGPDPSAIATGVQSACARSSRQGRTSGKLPGGAARVRAEFPLASIDTRSPVRCSPRARGVPSPRRATVGLTSPVMRNARSWTLSEVAVAARPILAMEREDARVRRSVRWSVEIQHSKRALSAVARLWGREFNWLDWILKVHEAAAEPGRFSPPPFPASSCVQPGHGR